MLSSMRIFAAGLLCLPSAALADCVFQTSSDELSRQLDAAEAAYAKAEVAAFQEALDEVNLGLPCVTDTLSASLASRIHRITAIRMFGDADKERSREALRAARRSDFGARLDTALIPDGHPLRNMFDIAAEAELGLDPVPVPAQGTLLLDGKPLPGRPMSQATIVQLVAPDGKPITSRYVWPDDDWLAYEGTAPAVAVTEPDKPDPVKPDPLPKTPKPGTSGNPLLVVSGISAVLAAGGLTGALVTKGTWTNNLADYEADPEAHFNDADTLKTTNNALFIGGLGLGGVAIITGTVSLTGTF